VVWQLSQIDVRDAAPSANPALRVDDVQANSGGGFMRITALNDGECAPGAGTPTSGIQQRFIFRWKFDRDASEITYPDRIAVQFSIEADGDVPCLDLNPLMTIAADGQVLDAALSGERYYWHTDTAGQRSDPRVVEVWTPESGLERSNTAHTPFFKIAIWGFRGNRGMQMEVTYPYTLRK
jgi:hypothetical protein